MSASAHDSDETLVSMMGEGDKIAADILVARYYQSLSQHFYRVVNCVYVADDLFQETWTNVFSNLGLFKKGSVSGGFRAWLFCIASNKLIDHWRRCAREKRMKAVLITKGEEAMPDASALLEITEEWVKVKCAIDRLPFAQKQIVSLRLDGQLTFSEIATSLGCPLGTVTGRMNKAVKKLRRFLK